MAQNPSYPHLLPDGSEIARLRALPKGQRPTFEAIGKRYGVSRQAAHKAYQKWMREQIELADSVEIALPV